VTAVVAISEGGVTVSIAYLAIEKDITVHDKEKALWHKCGVSNIRVDSMTAGIEKAINNQFLFIVINADNINYMPELESLRAITNDPIFIATSTFTIEEQVKALHNGADFYWNFSGSENNMKTILAVIHRINERAKQLKTPVQLITHRNILVLPSYRQVFVNDKEVELTKIEFDILYYIMSNNGHVLSYEQIFYDVWGYECDELTDEVVKSAIKRLRKKIDGEEKHNSLIQNVRGVGYKIRKG